jgi:hypothetical protein
MPKAAVLGLILLQNARFLRGIVYSSGNRTVSAVFL